MPFPLVAMLGLGALSGLGSALAQRKKSETNTTQTETGTIMPVEDPAFAAFRNQLIGMYTGLAPQLLRPYGDAEKAQAVQAANDLFLKSTEAAKNALARMGVLNSGMAGMAALGAEQQRQAQIAEFLMTLPEKQRTLVAQTILPYLALGAEWVGRAPVGEKRDITRTGSGFESAGPSGLGTFGSILGGMGQAGLLGLLLRR